MLSQTGVPAPLNEKERKKLEENRRKLKENIQKQKCKDFLENYLGAKILTDIASTLDSHQAFSGPRSTDLTVVEAGILSANEVARMNQIIQAGGPAARSAQYEMNRSVAQFFSDNNGQHGRKVEAAVGNYNGNPNTAFYRGFEGVKILHEALHIATGLGDDDLAKKLGIDITPFGGDSQLASQAITKKLKENGCK